MLWVVLGERMDGCPIVEQIHGPRYCKADVLLRLGNGTFILKVGVYTASPVSLSTGTY